MFVTLIININNSFWLSIILNKLRNTGFLNSLQLINYIDLKNPLEFIWEKNMWKQLGERVKKKDFAEKYIPLNMFIEDIMLRDIYSLLKLAWWSLMFQVVYRGVFKL